MPGFIIRYSISYPSMCVTEMCPHNGEIAFEAPCNELCSAYTV